MNTRDLAAGAACVLLAAGYGWLAAQLPARSLPNTPGPAFVPWVLAVALGVLGALLALSALRQPASAAPAAAGMGRPAAALAALACYVALLPWAGFMATSIAFCAALMWIAGERRWWAIAAGAVGMPLALTLVFRYGFQILLPRGMG